MKTYVAVCALLLGLPLPMFGLRTPSRSRQFGAKHLTIPATKTVARTKRKLPAPLTHEQKVAVALGAQSRGARHFGASNTATTSVGLITAPLIPLGGEDDDEDSAVIGDFNGDGKKDVAKLISNYDGDVWVDQISILLSNGDGTFKTAIVSTLAVSSDDPILAGDLNGDGKDDILQVHPSGTPATVDVYLSKGDGTFATAVNAPLSAFSLSGGVLTDVNGDGKLDLLMVDSESHAVVSYALGNGDGTFQAPLVLASLGGTAPYNIFFADFNGDGKMDFAGQTEGGQITVYLSSGSTYASYNLTESNYKPCNNIAADLTGDSRPEIISANCNDDSITIYVNNGDGSFQNGVYYSVPGAGYVEPYGLAVADFNRDGKNDVVVSLGYAGQIALFKGKGDGTLTIPTIAFSTGGYSWETPLVADFNGDGNLDIMESNDTFTMAYLQGYGDGTFRTGRSYFPPETNGDTYSYGIASGDFNGDGIADVVVGQDADSNSLPGVIVLLANADGSLRPGVSYGSSRSLEYVAVGDFNGDGKLDIAAADSSNGVIQIFLGRGDGTFTVGGTFATDTNEGSDPQSMVVGDFNHDGQLDIAVANYNGQNVGVLLGVGDGTFSIATNYALGTYVDTIAAGDLDGDGYLDLAVTLPQTDGDTVEVLMANNDNSGTFKAPLPVAIGIGYPQSIAIGDVNGDGKADLAVTITNGLLFEGGVTIALGNGDGSFGTAVDFASTILGGSIAYPSPGPIVMADFDGDGKMDLIYSNSEYGNVAIMYGKGDGTFFDPIDFGSSAYSWGLTLADVNNDGAVDVVVANEYANGATVLLNNSGNKTQPGFALGVSQTSQTVAAGSSATYGVTMNGQNGYSGTVSFTCSGLPAKTSCTFSPASASVSGNASVATTLTISTTAATSAALTSADGPKSKLGSRVLLASLSSLGMFGMVLAGSNKKRRVQMIITATVVVMLAITLVGCSGVSSGSSTTTPTSGTPAGTYNIVIQGTGTANVSRTTNVQLIVQ